MLKHITYTVYANKICIFFLQIVHSLAYQWRQATLQSPFGFKEWPSLKNIQDFVCQLQEQAAMLCPPRSVAKPVHVTSYTSWQKEMTLWLNHCILFKCRFRMWHLLVHIFKVLLTVQKLIRDNDWTKKFSKLFLKRNHDLCHIMYLSKEVSK